MMTPKIKRLYYFILMFTIMAFMGCATKTSGMKAIGQQEGNAEFSKHLIIDNDPLAAVIIIEDMNTRMNGGVLEVSVSLANISDRDINAQYQFSWYDKDNFQVEQGTRAWTPIVLHGKSKTSMQALAPNTTVSTYKVNVRELR